MSRRPGLVVVVWVALLLAIVPGAAWAHPWHSAAGGPGERVEWALSGSAPVPANGPVLPDHAAAPPLALAAGALALIALVAVRRRPLALGLVLVVAMASFEGVFHAALHLHHVSHPDGLAIGASAATPTGLSPDAEIPAAPAPFPLGPAPEHGGELGTGLGHASHQGRAPPVLPA